VFAGVLNAVFTVTVRFDEAAAFTVHRFGTILAVTVGSADKMDTAFVICPYSPLPLLGPAVIVAMAVAVAPAVIFVEDGLIVSDVKVLTADAW
jgi:hypothetical protein